MRSGLNLNHDPNAEKWLQQNAATYGFQPIDGKWDNLGYTPSAA